NLSKEDPNAVVPRGRVVNVYITLQAENELLIRHEGGEDISLATIGNEKYPIILYDKIQSAWRRNILAILRKDYDKHVEEINKLRGNNNTWNCMLRPTSAAKKEEEKMGGLCRECPNCMTFGFAVAEEAKYNLKSRVEGDLFIATTPEQKSVVVRTFNAVDDVTKTTFIETEGSRTGSLFRLSLVRSGTIFVGKVSMKDVTPAEFGVLMLSLATIPRIGGNTTDFGNVKIRIPAVILSPYEVSSGLDLFNIAKGLESVDLVNAKVKEKVKNYSKEGLVYTFDDLGDTVVKSLTNNGEVDHEIVSEAWRDGINLKKSIELFIQSKK
ncbi:type I-D CRISPR-associated protein Cas7/Csc2, partial [Sulfolobus sp. E3]